MGSSQFLPVRPPSAANPVGTKCRRTPERHLSPYHGHDRVWPSQWIPSSLQGPNPCHTPTPYPDPQVHTFFLGFLGGRRLLPSEAHLDEGTESRI